MAKHFVYCRSWDLKTLYEGSRLTSTPVFKIYEMAKTELDWRLRLYGPHEEIENSNSAAVYHRREERDSKEHQ